MLQGFRNSTALSNKYGVSLDPISRTLDAHKVMSFLALDDPAHLRLRTLVSKGFTPRRIRELEPRVTEIAVQHLDIALQSDTFDYVDEFAGKLPMDVISELMGVPEPDRARIRALADGVMHRDEGVADVPASAMQASAELMVYYADMVAERRKKPSDDLTSALLEAEVDGDRLDRRRDHGVPVPDGGRRQRNHHETACQRRVLGLEESRPAGAGSRRPLEDPAVGRGDAALRQLQPDPGPYRRRRADALRHTLPDGDVLLLLPGSANRDDRVFEDADEYRIGREIGSKLVSFGSGAHFCLGAHLARMEARVALTELFKRIRGYEVDEANAVRVHSSNVRGFAHLPITVKVA